MITRIYISSRSESAFVTIQLRAKGRYQQPVDTAMNTSGCGGNKMHIIDTQIMNNRNTVGPVFPSDTHTEKKVQESTRHTCGTAAVAAPRIGE